MKLTRFVISLALLAGVSGCAHAAPLPPPSPAAAPPAPAAAKPTSADAPLANGSDCAQAVMPDWTYDRAHNRVHLTGFAQLQAKLPPGWTVRRERPDQLQLTAKASVQGMWPVFEIFVSPRCKQPAGGKPMPLVAERLAARALADLLPPATATAQLNATFKQIGLESAQGLVFLGAHFQTSRGDLPATVYATTLAQTKEWTLSAGALCPVPIEKACAATYHDFADALVGGGKK